MQHTTVNIPNSYLNDFEGAYGVFNVVGDYYTPHFKNGDKVLINFNLEKDNPTNIYLIELDGKNELRHVIHTDNEKVRLEGINQYIPPRTVQHGQYKVIGFPHMLIRTFEEDKPCRE